MSSNKKLIRVLLVEDEDFTRAMVGEMLETSGITISSVNSVKEALSIIDEFDPHVVLTDLDLGHGPDGADLLSKVFTDRPWTGMGIMTSHKIRSGINSNALLRPSIPSCAFTNI